jgi:hypothetical protein
MITRVHGLFAAITGIGIAWLLLLASAAGQSSGAGTFARLSDGQPDVQGFWVAQYPGAYSLNNPRKGGTRLQEKLLEQKGQKPKTYPSRIVDPPDGTIPYLPWALAKKKDLEAHVDAPTKQEYIDPQMRCLPGGPIRAMFWTGYQVLQYPGYILFLYEQAHDFRMIPLDPHPHIGESMKLWMGDSRGHWEGNTLVVDVTNNNSKGRLDTEGNFAGEKLHVAERFIFTDSKTMDYEAVIEDPSVYSRPWKIASRMVREHQREPDFELWEDACHEGERNADGSLLTDVPKADSAK